jgi:hypothetical protein
LRSEKEYHRETKESYIEDMCKYILHILPLDAIGFDNNCRVTIYRKISSDEAHLREVFRHAGQPRFQSGGRVKIPSSQGIVGLVWNAVDQTYFVANNDPSNLRAHNKDCKDHCKPNNYRPETVPSGLRMPCLSYYARRLTSTQGRMAVIVLESLDKNRFDAGVCDEAFKLIMSDLLGACNILCSLDGQFNPVDGEGA